MRQIIARIIANKLVVYYSDPPEEHVAYRKQLLDLFVPIRKMSQAGRPTGIRQNLQRRWLINTFLNGNLQQSSEIQHFCGYSCCETPHHTLRYMSIFLSWALCPCKCPKFARSRWTNWLGSVEWVGLLSGVHNLLEAVIIEYTGGPAKPMNQEQQVVAAMPLENAQDQHDEWDDILEEELQEDTCQPIPIPNIGFPQPNAEEEPAMGGVGQDGEPSSAKPFDFKEFNKKQRGNAREFVQSMPYPRIVILRLVSGVLMPLMQRFLSLGGMGWERVQQLKAAKGLQRDYQITRASRGQDISNAMKALHRLFFTTVPCLLPSMVTARLKAMKFVLISSAMCAMHILLRLPRAGAPYVLFKLLEGDVDTVADYPECLHDELMHIILSRYAPRLTFEL